jgi:hypothetical protein
MKKLILLTLALSATAASFGQLSSQNVIVTLVGTGATNPSLTATRVALREYTISSTAVSTQVGSDIQLPYQASDAKKYTGQADEQSENNIRRSMDGRFLTMLGYAVAEGFANPGLNGSTGEGADRMTLRLPSSGNWKLGNPIKQSVLGGDSARVAILNGTDFYLGSGTGGVDLGAFGSSNPKPIANFINAIDQETTSCRVLNIVNGKLYYSSSDDRNETAGFFGNSLYGFNDIPVVETVPDFIAGTNNSIRDFFFLNPTTLYILSSSAGSASDAGSIMRFELQSGSWVKTAGTPFNGTTAVIPSLNNFVFRDGFFYATRANGSTLLRIPLDLSSATVIATAPTGKLFRGIAFGPVATKPVTGTLTLGDNDFDGRYPVQLEVIQNGNVIETTTVLSENGSYTLDTAVANGNYQLRAKGTTWLGKTINVTIGNSGATGANIGEVVNGDVDGDDEVSILDYITLSTNYGTQSDVSDFNEKGDLDGDGDVSILDYIVLSTNYGQSGS